MSKFKTNSRFGSLVENDSNNKEVKNNSKEVKSNSKEVKNSSKEESEKTTGDNNSFKKNYEKKYERAEDYCSRRINEEKFKKDEEKRVKEENIKKALAPESFPDFISNLITIKPVNYTASFLEKLQFVVINNDTAKTDIDLDYKNLEPGWALIKRDDTTNKIIVKKKIYLEVNTLEETDNIDILDALVDLNEKRIHRYIELWGYEEWEKMFRFPNYDYEYFDKLDELYYQELEEREREREKDDEEYYESITDYDKFNNYWNN